MTRLTLANGSELLTDSSVEQILTSIVEASPSPWINLTLTNEKLYTINSFIIGYMVTEE